MFSYPATHYNKKGKSFATTVCYFQSSDEEKKKKFLSNLKKDAKISNMESSGDVFSYEIDLGKEGEHVMLHHTKQIFFVKPVINHPEGYEYWEVASHPILISLRLCFLHRVMIFSLKVCVPMIEFGSENIFPSCFPSSLRKQITNFLESMSAPTKRLLLIMNLQIMLGDLWRPVQTSSQIRTNPDSYRN